MEIAFAVTLVLLGVTLTANFCARRWLNVAVKERDKDVAVALGCTNPLKAVRDHVDGEDKGVNESFTPGGKQKFVVINESGLYSLVLSSKLESAKRFKRWVTSEQAIASPQIVI